MSDNVQNIPSIESVCQRCHYDENHIPSSSAFTRRSSEVSRNVSHLKEAAQAGCWLCSCYVAAMHLWIPVDRKEVNRIIHLKVRYDKERFTIRGPAALPVIQIYTPREEPTVYRLIADEERSSTASSDQSQRFMQTKLQDCLQNHPACHGAMQSLQRVPEHWPKRILKIVNDGTRVALRLASFEPIMKQKYVALSYCWGCDPTKYVRADRTTISQLQKGIDIAKLPKTLSDAVKASMSIGSNLIWIDSLCILQDSPTDWDEEAGKMSAVYTYSLVTIIASSASTCGDGFLDQAREKSVLLTKIRVGIQTSQIRARIVRDWGHHRGGPQSDETHRLKWVDPVDLRGWTLQEKLLSTRYMTFTSGEVQWGCQTTKTCECGQPLYGKLYNPMQPEEQWLAVIEEYSTRNLTQRTDVLTALAGIARKISASLHWKWYAAGIWMSTEWNTLMVRSLLWYRESIRPPSYFPEIDIAPSFSWASVVGEMLHYGPRSYACSYPSTVVSVDVQPATSDIFGRVTAGALRMKGPLIKAEIRVEKPDKFSGLEARLKILGFDRNFYLGCKMDGPVEKVRLRPGETSDCFTVKRCRTTTLEETLEMRKNLDFDAADVFLLPILVYTTSHYTSTKSAECLILARSTTFPGFERIGMKNVIYNPSFEELPLEDVSIF